jgi:putative thioredoxin
MPTAAFDFDRDVLAPSHQRPFLVDFWAPWCGPCRALGPTLDRLASETDDWTLVKVNTDEHPELMSRFGVRGIPAVKLFAGGEVAAEFTGVLPEHAVRQWLAEHLPSERKADLASARRALDAGLHALAAQSALAHALADPTDTEARLLAGAALALTDPARASDLLAGIDAPAGRDLPLLEAARAMAARGTLDLPPGPGREPSRRALDALDANNPDAAARALLDALQAERTYADDLPRRLGVALFTLLGPAHDATQAHRRAFDRLLY